MKISLKIIEEIFQGSFHKQGDPLGYNWSIILNCLLRFLKIGGTSASFHISGYMEVDKVSVKII